MMAVENPLTQRQLFGGAIELACPPAMLDISDFRPVPDHQEAFADGAKDQSLVVEILEHQANVTDAAASGHYFEDLAAQNDAITSLFDGPIRTDGAMCPYLPSETYTALAAGTQEVSKGRQASNASNTVQILLAVIRLPQHGSDLVLSLNTPLFISQHSAAAEHAGAGSKTEHLAALSLFPRILASLRVVDYGLFDGNRSPDNTTAA